MAERHCRGDCPVHGAQKAEQRNREGGGAGTRYRPSVSTQMLPKVCSANPLDNTHTNQVDTMKHPEIMASQNSEEAGFKWSTSPGILRKLYEK